MTQEQPFPRATVWLAVVISILVYGVLAFTVFSGFGKTTLVVPNVVLWIVAAGSCLIALLMVKGTMAGIPAHVRDLVAWISMETVALVGLFAAWLAESGAAFLPYGLVALVVLILLRPRE